MNYILGQLVWKDQRWNAPDSRDRFLDLRPLRAQATPQNAQGHVLIATERDPRGREVLLLDDHRAVLTFYARDAVRDLLRIPDRLTSETLPSLVQALLGDYSDPDVDLICPPIMPDVRGVVRFRLGDVGYSHRIRTDAHWQNVLKVLRQTYRSARSLGGNLHRKLLTVWCDQYGIANYETFIPSDLPKETPLPHETTIRDNFDVGNHFDLDGQASSDGWTWTRIQGGGTGGIFRTTTQVYAETVVSFSGRCVYRAESDLSSPDHYVQGQIRTNADTLQVGLIARKDSSATMTFYEVLLNSGADQLQIAKYVGGTGTNLQNNALTINTATFYTIKFNLTGSTLQTFNSASQVGADLTDTAISAGTRCGMCSQVSGVFPETGGIEDFEASDGLDPAATVREVASRSDRASAQVVEALAPVAREVVARSDRASVSLVGSLTPIVRETVARSDRASAAVLSAFEVTARDVRFLSDRASAGTQVPYSDEMVILTHIHGYFEDDTFGFSSRHVNGLTHDHPGKVILHGGSEREIPIPPTGPPRCSDMVVEFDDSDQYFRKTFGARTPKHRKVDFRIGPRGGVEAMFQTPATGLITDVKFPPGRMRLYVSDFRNRWMQQLIPSLVNTDIFPDLPQASRGAFAPYVFGDYSSAEFGGQGALKLIHVDNVNHRYLVARHPVFEITTLYKKGLSDPEFIALDPNDYTFIQTEEVVVNGLTYHFSLVQFPADQQGAEFQADVKGMYIFGAWGLFPEHTDYASRNAIDQAIGLLYHGERIERVNLNYHIYAFADVRERLEELEWFSDFAITQQVTWEAVLTRLFGERLIHWFPNRRDQFYVTMTPEELPDDAPRFGDAYHILRESEMQELAQETKNRILYDYGQLIDGSFAGHGIYNNLTDQAALLDENGDPIIESETLTLTTVRDGTVAEEIATEWGVWRDQDAHRFRMELDMPSNIEQDRVELAREALITNYGGLKEGGWVRERFFPYRIRDEYDRRRFVVDLIRRPAVATMIDQVVGIGRWSWNHLPGPDYIATNKQVFSTFVDDRAGLKKMVVLTQDEDGVDEPVDDGAFPMLDNVIRSSQRTIYNNKIYVATQEENTGRVAGHIFDCLLREWILLNFEFLESNSHGDCGVSCCVRQPSGQFGIMYQGDRGVGTGNMGQAGPGFYKRAKFKYIDDNGDLSAEFDLCTPDDLYAIDWFPAWGDPNYLGKVQINVGRCIAEEGDRVRFMMSVDEPADVASTSDLYTQILSGEDVLTPAHEFKRTIAAEFTPIFAYGDPSTFTYNGVFHTAVPVGLLADARVMIWLSTSAAGGPDYDIPVGSLFNAELSPDTFGTLSPPFGVRADPGTSGRLTVILGTRSTGQDDWAAYKTIDPPYTTAVPGETSRQSQIGPTWPGGNYARQGFDVAVIRGKKTIFKSTSGNFGLPDLSGYRISEKIIVSTDVPGDNDFTVADFIAANS